MTPRPAGALLRNAGLVLVIDTIGVLGACSGGGTISAVPAPVRTDLGLECPAAP